MGDAVSVEMPLELAEEILELLEARVHWYRRRYYAVPERTMRNVARMQTIIAAFGALAIAEADRSNTGSSEPKGGE